MGAVKLSVVISICLSRPVPLPTLRHDTRDILSDPGGKFIPPLHLSAPQYPRRS
jgi:hypothetical protein